MPRLSMLVDQLRREPLVHFLVLAALLFALDSVFSSTQKPKIIVDRQTAEFLIQQALDRKDWSKASEQAARLLRLNPFEARSLAAAEANHAAQTATQLLWDKYHPNRNVWLPIVAIGILAMLAFVACHDRVQEVFEHGVPIEIPPGAGDCVIAGAGPRTELHHVGRRPDPGGAGRPARDPRVPPARRHGRLLVRGVV